MLYDHNVNQMSEVHAPVQANVIIRSQASQNAKNTGKSPVSTAAAQQKNASRFDLNKFTSFLAGITRQTSTQKCARSIRIGLQSAGAKIVNHPVAAADWGNTLTKLGYQKINLSFERPKKGDIYIIDRTSKHRYGHIAAYSGTAWVSDFKQRSHDVYRNSQVKYTYYRLPE
jgi:hypothetical protein